MAVSTLKCKYLTLPLHFKRLTLSIHCHLSTSTAQSCIALLSIGIGAIGHHSIWRQRFVYKSDGTDIRCWAEARADEQRSTRMQTRGMTAILCTVETNQTCKAQLDVRFGYYVMF